MNNNLFNIKDKVVVITGGSGFLGRNYVKFLSEQGARVINVDIGSEYAANITDEKEVAAVVRKIEEKYGRIDVLLNNASFNIHIDQSSITKLADIDYLAPFEDYNLDAYTKGITVDLVGSVLMCKYVLPVMKKKKSGSIINIGSVYGLVSPDQRLYAGMKNPQRPELDIVKPAYYSVAKAGLWGLTFYLAGYAGPDIRVNQLSLGGIRNKESTEFIAKYSAKTMLGRMGQLDDIYGPLLFLASDASKYMTGQNLIIDGGFTAW